MRPVKTAILGYAHYMRTNFVKHFKTCPDIDIIGVYNRGEERRQHAEDDGFYASSDLEEILDLAGLEAVVVGTANVAHKGQAILAAERGLHIMCEKPIALSTEEATAMTEAAERAGVVTQVNHWSPFSATFREFKSIMHNKLGRPLHAWVRSSRGFGTWSQGARHASVANPESSGGWTIHHLCHALNEACILLGTSKATRVYHLVQVSTPGCPSEEIVNCLITFEDGSTAMLTDGLTIGGFCDLGVQCENGDMRLVNGTITIVTPGPHDPTQRPGSLTQVKESIGVRPGSKEIEKCASLFAQAIRGGENELLSFRFIRDQYLILDALRKSARIGRTVDL